MKRRWCVVSAVVTSLGVAVTGCGEPQPGEDDANVVETGGNANGAAGTGAAGASSGGLSTSGAGGTGTGGTSIGGATTGGTGAGGATTGGATTGGTSSGGTTTGGSGTGGTTTGGAITGGAETGGAGTGGAETGGAGTGGAETGGAGTGSTGAGGTSGDGGQVNGTGGSGATPSDLPPRICDEPTLWTPPATSRVVGDGTAASCTEEALRQAVTAGGHVRFDCGDAPVTIAVSDQVSVATETVVDGEGRITLDGGGTSRIFWATSALSVRNLRFVNGSAPSTMEAEGIGGAVAGGWRSRVEVYGCTFEDNSAARGGGAVAVWTGSSLTVVASRFYRNSSWYGGAVYSLLSPLTIVNSEFLDNTTRDESDGTQGEGGAIGTDGASEYPDDAEGGTIEICGSQIRDNGGMASGGGAYIWVYPPDVVRIDRTTVEGNTSAVSASGGGSLGGGMRISNGEIIVTASSFLSNHAESHGGGLYLDCAPTCTITNTTFFANEATPATGTGAGYGGAIFGGGFRLNNVTLAHNFANGHGGALFGGQAVIENSLFVDNAAGNPWGQANSCSETGTGANVLQWLSADGNGGSDLCIPEVLVADPGLAAAPADNGGPTFTLLHGAGGPAVRAGSACESVDQRGEPRDPDDCDLGAVELD